MRALSIFDRNCTTGSAGILPALARHARWHGHAARAVDAGVRHFGNRTLSMIAVQPLAALGAQPGVAVPLAVAQALLPGMFVSVRMGGTLSPRSGRHPVTIVQDSGCACFWVGLRPLIAGRLILNWASPLAAKRLCLFLEFLHFRCNTTPAPRAPPLLIRGGELLGTPLLIQEGKRRRRRGGYMRAPALR